MAEFILASPLQKSIWSTKYFVEYVRSTRFEPYMANAEVNKGGIFLVRKELMEEAGKTINIPFIGRLKSAGVTGATVLDGAEDELTTANMPISIDWRRNGIRFPKSSTFTTEINLMNAGRTALNVWSSEKLRDDIIKAMAMIPTDTIGTEVTFDASTAAQQAFWLTANTDRVLFGGLKANLVASSFATSAGNVANTAKVSTAMIATAKRMAKSADPHIRPFQHKDSDGREFYVAFHGSRTFRDLGLDPNMLAANSNARPREGDGMKENPLFQDGDLIFQGVIHREVPEIDDYCNLAGFNGIGGSGGDIRPIFLCGAGAVGIAWGQEPTPRTDYLKDYGFRPGVAIEELLGVKKIVQTGVQNGMVTLFAAAPGDG